MEDKDKGTNEFAEEIEQDKAGAQRDREFRKKYIGYQERINDFLRRQAYQDLQAYFQTEEMGKICRIENDAAIMGIILSIYQMELEEGIQKGILSGIFDLKSAEERYLKIKFLIWRFEFLNEKEKLFDLIEKEYVSVPFFKYLIHTSSFEKANTSFKIAMLMKEKAKWGQAFAMLNYVDELSPGEEVVFCEMADICISVGQVKNAMECLKRIEKPSELFVKYQEKWGI